MARALLVVGLAAPLLAASWMRLEHGHDAAQATVVILLALVPALLRGWWRVAAAFVALLAAGAVAFGAAPVWALPGRLLGHFGSGFLQFYDVQVPFERAAQPEMHGVLLLALFAFMLVFTLAVAARRPGLASLALLVGVGWPATLLPGHDLLLGALLLVALLVTIALLRRDPARTPVPALLAGALVVGGALAATTSPALAKHAFLNWQHWDLYTRPARPVDVSYVWNSSYSGLTFRGKPTTVFRVKAGSQPHYWRVSVLDTVLNGHWIEETAPEFGAGTAGSGSSSRSRRCATSDCREGAPRWSTGRGTVSATSPSTRAESSPPTSCSRAATRTTSGATSPRRRPTSSPPPPRFTAARSSRGRSTAKSSTASTRGSSAGRAATPTCAT